MWWIVLALAVAAGVLFLRRRRRTLTAPQISTSGAGPAGAMPSPSPATIEVAVRRPVLPEGRAAMIVASLRAGKEPDESWIRSDGKSDEVRLLPYSAQFVSVAGESFDNPDGVSRQDVLKRVRPGTEVFLIPEPTNRFDPNAVAVYADYENGDTGQIGYLPRDHNISGDVAAGKVIAWLSRVDPTRDGTALGATLYLLIHNR